MNKEINIGREIDLVIKQANRFIAYKTNQVLGNIFAMNT